MSGLFDKTLNGLATSLSMRQMRQSVISSNVANAETPGYHAKKIDFEEALGRAMDLDGMNSMTTSSRDHIGLGSISAVKARPEIYENPDVEPNNDGNTVDVEKEMAALSENAILYKTALHLINKKMAALKYAASEGR
jgi:flagellar basal-body rod protein FlgB